MKLAVPDPEATLALGKSLGPLLFPGAVIALIGPLGAGKTTFTRAVAEGLGVQNLAAVNSPTFTLIHEYPARLPIYHFDAYRLATAEQFEGLGIQEYFAGDGVCFIEWADKFLESLPAERLEIHIERLSETERRWELIAAGGKHDELLTRWLCDCGPTILNFDADLTGVSPVVE